MTKIDHIKVASIDELYLGVAIDELALGVAEDDELALVVAVDLGLGVDVEDFFFPSTTNCLDASFL